MVTREKTKTSSLRHFI